MNSEETPKPFVIKSSTITQLALHYHFCTEVFMVIIEPVIWKCDRLRDHIERCTRGRYPTLTPKEVQYIVDHMEGVKR